MERKDRGARQSRRRRSSFESHSPLRAVTDGEFKRRSPPDLSEFRPAKIQPEDLDTTASESEQADDKLANSAGLPVAAAGKSTLVYDEALPGWASEVATSAIIGGALVFAAFNPVTATVGLVVIAVGVGTHVAMQYIENESQWKGVDAIGDIVIEIPDGADESWLRAAAGDYIASLLDVKVTLTDVGQQDFSTIFGGGSGGNLLTLGESSTATARATDNPFDVDDIYEGVLDDTLLDDPLSQFPSPTELPDATGSQAIDSAIPQIDTYSQPGIDSTNASIPNSDRADAEAEDLLRRRTQQLSSLDTYYEGILVQYGQSPQQSEALEALKSKLTPEQAADLARGTGILTDQFRTLAWQTGTSYSSATAAGAAEAAEQSLLLRNYREGAEIAFFRRSLSAEERVAFDAFYEGLADTSGVDRKADDIFEKFERRAPDASDRTSSLWISVRNSTLAKFYSWGQVMRTVVPIEAEQSAPPPPPAFIAIDDLRESEAERRTRGEETVAQAESARTSNLSAEEQSIAVFKALIKDKASAQLVNNRQLVLAEQVKIESSSSADINRLRQLVIKDDEFASRQAELTAQSNVLQSNVPLDEFRESVAELHGQQDLLEGQPTAAAEAERLAGTNAQLETMMEVRQTLRVQNPAVGVLNPREVSAARSDSEVRESALDGLDRILHFIDEVEVGINEDDIPLIELGPIVSIALGEMDEAGRAYAQQYVEEEKTRERNNSYRRLAVELGLTIAAIFASGGWALLFAGLGTVVGVHSAAYEFERANDLRSAANAGVPGSEFVDNPDAARFNYTMAVANLVLAGVDLGITGLEGATLLNRASREASSAVILKMQPEQIKRLGDAIRLEEAGNVAGAERAYQNLQNELGFTDAQIDEARIAVSRFLGDGHVPIARAQDYVVGEELARRRGRVTASVGEELVVKAESNLKRLFDEADCFIAIKDKHLQGVLQDGRFLSAYDIDVKTWYSSSPDPIRETNLYRDRRIAAEQASFNYPADSPAEYRPISGYIASDVNALEARGASFYGQGDSSTITVRLSDNIKTRTTFTGDDSIMSSQNIMFTPNDTSSALRQPSPIESPNISSFLATYNIADEVNLPGILERVANADSLSDLHSINREILTGNTRAQYFELQFHGQVTVDDIEEIIILNGEITSETSDLANALGIPISY